MSSLTDRKGKRGAKVAPKTVINRSAANTVLSGKASPKDAASGKRASRSQPAKTKRKVQQSAAITASKKSDRQSSSGSKVVAMRHNSSSGVALREKKGHVETPPAAPGLPSGYRPSDSEPFMNERQRIYFRAKLTAWKDEIVRQNMETLQGLHEQSTQHADLADRATSETDRALELRARDRQRKLVAKIDAAVSRIDDGSYGYCEETGEPISLKRLEARPIATLSLEAQERHGRRERVFRED